MSEAVTTAPADAAPKTLSIASAAQALAEKRQATQQPQPNTSDAARILGQRAAQARQERLAEQQRQAQESSPEEGGNEQDDEAQGSGETLTEETASSEQTDATDTAAEAEPQDDGTIELEPGVKVTLDEVRDGFMMKADHTRKTQALAEERKSFEADRTQRLSLLDNLIGVAQASLGQPKSMKQWLAEDPIDGMMKFAEQQERLEQFGQLIQTRQQEQAHHIGQLKQATIRELSADHGDKAEEVYSKAVQYVSSKTGTDAKAVEAMLAHPEAVKMVQDAMAYRELKSKEKTITRTIADKPKVVKPGPRVSAQAQHQSAVKVAEAKARKSGSLADALNLLRASRAANPRT